MKKLTQFIPDVIAQPKTLAEIDGGVHLILAQAIADYRTSQRGVDEAELSQRVDAGEGVVKALLAKCESPIERLIVPSLVFQPYGSNGPWVPADLAGVKPRLSPVVIDAQVSMGGSRFDFLMMVEVGADELMIAVECDGAVYHDEVADYYRDRDWRRSGIHTVRLSGSDINHNPRMAASRVAEFVLQQMIARGLA